MEIVTFNSFLLNKAVVTSGISITNDATNIYFNVAATNIGNGAAIYAGLSNNILNFKSLNGGSFITIVTTDTTVTINTTQVNPFATNLGIPSYAFYAGTSNTFMSFKSLNAGSYINIIPTDTTLLINSSLLKATNIGIPSYAIFSNTSDTLNFKSLNVGSYITIVPTDTTLSINNQSPDQIVSISSSNITVTSAYPTFVLTSATKIPWSTTFKLASNGGPFFLGLNGGGLVYSSQQGTSANDFAGACAYMPVSGTIRGGTIFFQTGTSGAQRTVTLMKNGASTSLSFSVATDVQSASTSTTVTIAVGDFIAWGISNIVTVATTLANICLSTYFIPD